jgi:hypothetical protein
MIGGSTSYFSTPPVVDAGGIALVQSASGTTADGTLMPTVSFPSPITDGNAVFALISFASGSVVEVTFNGGQMSLVDEIAGTGVTVQIWAKTAETSGSDLTFTNSAAVRTSAQILEVSGLADAPAESTAVNTATSTTLAIGTITPTSANNLLTAIFAFNADVTAVGIANDVLVSGAGTAAANGTYTYRGQANGYAYFNLVGQPDSPTESAIANNGDPTWYILAANGDQLYVGTPETPIAFPWLDTFTTLGGDAPAPAVAEIPGWELVGTRTGGSSVWEYVYEKIQTTATPSNPTIVLSGSCDIAGAAAAFGGA